MSFQRIYLLENGNSENSKSTLANPNNQPNKSSRMVDKLPQHCNAYLSYIQTSHCSNISSITKDTQYMKKNKKVKQFLDNWKNSHPVN